MVFTVVPTRPVKHVYNSLLPASLTSETKGSNALHDTLLMTKASTETPTAKVRRLEREIEQIVNSRSWRWTEHLRLAAYELRGLFGVRRRWEPEPVDSAPPAVRPEDTVDTEPATTTDAIATLADAKARFTTLAETVLQEFLASGARMRFETADPPLVSIVLVIWNRAELTFQCLRSIAELRHPDFEVIVIDNASTDQVPELFSRIDGIRYVPNESNLGFVPAVNQAAALARGTHLLLLNNDAVLLPGALSAAVRTLESSDSIGAVGGKIVLLDGTLQEAGNIIWQDGSCAGYGRGDNPLAPQYMFRRNVDYCSGAFLLTRRELFLELGGLDETFMPIYYEETDFCVRLRDAGYHVVYEPRSVLLHYEFGSSTRENAVEQQLRNQKTFAARHHERLRRHSVAGAAHVLESRNGDRDQKRVLVIDDRIPHPFLGSGFPRANLILSRLVDWEFAVTFYPLAVTSEDWNDVYLDIPIDIEVMLDCGEAGLEGFLSERKGYYDTILVSRPHNMEKLRGVIDREPGLVADCTLIYDAEALFSFRETRQRELLGLAGENELEKRLDAEVDLARVADRIVAVSPREAYEFRNRGVEAVHVLGHAYTAQETSSSFLERSGFLFIGAIHATDTPNGDSILWFVNEVLPRIRESDPDAFLTIVGLVNSDEVAALASDSVRIVGPADDLGPHYERALAFIAPTRFSAGVPLKVTEAAARGLPVVVTSLLAEQLDWQHDRELLVGDTPELFAHHCLRLSTDTDVWHRMRTNALRRVREEYSTERFDRTLLELVGPSRRLR